jgi:16S rRNA G966 N2-methylase RsmD
MATKQKSTPVPVDNALKNVSDYRFPEATRKNNPPAKIAAEGYVSLIPKAEYLYSPRRPPELRFDPTGHADELPELLAKATQQKLTEAEAWALAEALRVHEPWLEWAGKREAKTFAVDPVALHIHERVSTQAILRVAAREDVNHSLFADPEQEYNEAVQFYKHDVDWSNRLILGDSLQVMSSLARREDLAGKVQMIYMDPPYGIKFASNFQNEIGRRDVKDNENDLTREPEMVKAYRDTWTNAFALRKNLIRCDGMGCRCWTSSRIGSRPPRSCGPRSGTRRVVRRPSAVRSHSLNRTARNTIGKRTCKPSSSRPRVSSWTSWRSRVRMPRIGGGAYWRCNRDISFSRRCSGA